MPAPEKERPRLWILTSYNRVSTWVCISVNAMCSGDHPVGSDQGPSTNVIFALFAEPNLPRPYMNAGRRFHRLPRGQMMVAYHTLLWDQKLNYVLLNLKISLDWMMFVRQGAWFIMTLSNMTLPERWTAHVELLPTFNIMRCHEKRK